MAPRFKFSSVTGTNVFPSTGLERSEFFFFFWLPPLPGSPLTSTRLARFHLWHPWSLQGFLFLSEGKPVTCLCLASDLCVWPDGGVGNLTSLTKGAPFSGSAESSPLDHQGSLGLYIRSNGQSSLPCIQITSVRLTFILILSCSLETLPTKLSSALYPWIQNPLRFYNFFF